MIWEKTYVMAQKQNSLQLNQVLEFEIWPYCWRGNAHQMMDIDYNFKTYIFPIFILSCVWARAIYISKLIYTLEGQKSLYWCHRQSYLCPQDLISEISSNIVNTHLEISMISSKIPFCCYSDKRISIFINLVAKAKA